MSVALDVVAPAERAVGMLARHPAPRRPGERRDDDALCDAALDRVALLLPAIAYAARRDPLDYALAFVEHYPDDVVQLEREWDFLRGALDCALRRDCQAIALRIAAALAYPAGRRGQLAEGEYVVRLGIEAARQIGDRRMLGLLVNRLGGLRFTHGHYRQGWRLWRAGVELEHGPGGRRLGWWAPRISFAASVDLLGRFGGDRPIVELLTGESECDDAEALAVALFVRGFHAHRFGRRDQAYDDISAALRLCAQASGARPTEPWHVLSLTMQTEMARLHGDEDRVRECTTTAIALSRVASDRYTTAALITDQALWTYYQGRLDESRALMRTCETAVSGGEPLPIEVRGRRFLAEYLAEPALDGAVTPLPALPRGPTPRIRLSERETEVLRLVAAGYSTRAIAAVLVVTPATVKKHLEHLYARLDAHSRTAAVATARALGLLN